MAHPGGQEPTQGRPRRPRAGSALRPQYRSVKGRGDYIDPRAGKATVAHWADKWLGAVRSTLKPKTAASYESLLRSRVLPSLGHRRISKLKPSDVQDWIGKLQAEGLSASRIRQAHVVLRQVLDMALRDGAVARNAAIGVKLPKLERREAAFFEPGVVEIVVVLCRISGRGGQLGAARNGWMLRTSTRVTRLFTGAGRGRTPRETRGTGRGNPPPRWNVKKGAD